MNILAPGYPTSQVMTCGGGTSDTIEETPAASNSGLTYDNATDVYVWKTERAWKGTCRQLIVKLSDGTTPIANFQFR